MASSELKKAMLSATIILLTLLAVTIKPQFSPTGFATHETSITQTVNLSFNTTAETSIHLQKIPASIRISGTVIGDGTASVYLVINNQKLLMLNSSSLETQKQGLEGITGKLTENLNVTNNTDATSITENQSTSQNHGNESENSSSTNQTQDKAIRIRLEYNQGTPFDPDDDGVERADSAIDMTVAGTEFGWEFNKSNLCTVWKTRTGESSTLSCNGAGQCCSLVNLEPTTNMWNDTFYAYYGKNRASYKNTISAQVIFADISLEPENVKADIAHSEISSLDARFLKIARFSNACEQTCSLSINQSDATLLVETEGATVSIDSLAYTTRWTTNSAPVATREIPPMSIEKSQNATINLSEYFMEPDNDTITYTYISPSSIKITINRDIASIVPDGRFTGTAIIKFTASDELLETDSNSFLINVTGNEKQEEEPNETLMQGNAEIGREVSWTKKIRLSKAKNATTSVPSSAKGIIVKKAGRNIEDSVLVIDKGKTRKLKEGKTKLDTSVVTESAPEREENITLQIEDNSTSYDLEYLTEAPVATEREISRHRKQITISSGTHYTNILTHTNITESPRNSVRLYWYVNGTKELFPDVKYIDMNNNGRIDRLEWITPSLSTQQFEVEIIVLNAYTFLRNNDTWTVAFNTTGTANLTINSTNAKWAELLEDIPTTHDEIKFINISCGSESMNSQLAIIDSNNNRHSYQSLTGSDSIKAKDFYIQDYNCDNQTSTISNLMNVAGYATLMFSFGGQTAFAYDPLGTISFVSPTDNDNTTVGLRRNYTYVNISITGNTTAIDWAVINWNGTNVTLDSPDLLLSMDFDNNTQDNSRYGNNGSMFNDVNCSSGVPGAFGSACNFEMNTTAYINLGDPPTLRLNKSFSIEGWIRTVKLSPTGYNGIFRRSNDQTRIYLTNGALQYFGTIGTVCTGATTLSVNKWYHFAFTRTPNGTNYSIEVYLNGALDKQCANTQEAYPGSAGTWSVGWDGFNNQNLNGSLDEIKIWNRSLSSAEINASYNAKRGRFVNGTVNYFANFSNLAQGNYTYFGWVNDTAANQNSTTNRNFILDFSPPFIGFGSSTDNNASTLTRNWTFVNFSFTGVDNDTFIISFNGTNYTGGQLTAGPGYFYRNFTDLLNKNYYFYGWINDTAANQNSTTNRQVTVAAQPFMPAFTTPTDNDNTTVGLRRNYTYINITITGNTSAIHTAIVNWNGTNVTLDSPELLTLIDFDNSTQDNGRLGSNGNVNGPVNCSAGVTGWSGSACSFNGVNTSVNFGSKSLTGNTTISLWIYPTSPIVAREGILGLGDDSGIILGSMPLTNMTLWLKADTITGVSNASTLTAWNDSSPNGVNMTGTATYVNPSVNQKPAVRFDGSQSLSKLVGATSLIRVNESSVIFVAKHNSADGRTELFGMGNCASNRYDFYYPYDNDIVFQFPNNPGGQVQSMFTRTPAGFEDTFGIFQVFRKEYNISMIFNGTQINSTNVTVNPFVDAITTFKIGDGPCGQIFTGDLAEIIFYNNTYSTNARKSVEYYLSRKYNIALTEPAANSEDGIKLMYYNGTNQVVSSQNISLNTWTNIVYVYNGSGLSLYINGNLDSQGMIMASLTTLQVGAQNTSDFFNGTIDEIRIWNKSLSASEISSAYSQKTGRRSSTSFFANFTSLADGNYTYFAWANDTAANQNSTLNRNLIVDATTPAISSINASPVDWHLKTANTKSITFSFNTTETYPDKCSVWHNATGSFSENMTASYTQKANSTIGPVNFSQDGSYNFSIACNDTAGNKILYSINYTILIDSSAPSVALAGPANASIVNGANVSFQYNASDALGNATCELWTNITGAWSINKTQAFRNGLLDNFSTTNLAFRKSYLWNVQCNDTAKNYGTNLTNYSLYVLQILPTLTYTTPTDNDNKSVNIRRNYTFINFTITGNNSAIHTAIFNWNGTNQTLQSNGTTAGGLFYSINETSLAEGNYTYFAWANDTDSNENSTPNRALIVDYTNPSAAFTSATEPDRTSINLGRNWTYINASITEKQVHTAILNWNGTNQTLASNGSGYYAINKTSLSEGNYTFFVWANDSASNEGSTTARTIVVDYTSPTYANSANNASTSTQRGGIANWSARISDENGLANVSFRFNDTGSYVEEGPYSIAGTSYFINITKNITGLKGRNVCGIFTFNDSAANQNTTNASCFTVANTPLFFTQNVSAQTVTVGSQLFYDINCTDYDNDTITYYDNTTLFNINSSNGTINYTPAAGEEGIHSINISCDDGTINVSQVFTLNTIDSATPTYSQLTNNASTVTPNNGIVNWSLTLADNVGLSAYIFSWNNSGSFTNDTAIPIRGQSNFTNVTKTVTQSKGAFVCAKFYFNDTSNNQNSTSNSCFTVANAPPRYTQTLTTQTTRTGSTLNYQVNCTDADNDSITYSDDTSMFNINSLTGAISHSPTESQVGTYTITITCNDGTDISQQSFTYIINDGTAPTYTGLTNNASTATLANGTANWSLTLADGVGLQSYIFSFNDTGSFANDTPITISGTSTFINVTKTITSTGYKQVCGKFYFNDTSNNQNSTSNSCFTVKSAANNTPPSNPTILFPINNSYINYATVPLNVSSSDADNDTITYYHFINDTLNTTSSGANTTFTGADGSYAYNVYASDGINITSNTSKVYFIKDSIIPLISYGAATTANGTSFRQSWIYINVTVNESSEANITFSLHNSTGLYTETTYTSATRTINWTSLRDGQYYFNVTVYDLAGNKNSTPTRNASLDTTPPMILNASLMLATNESVTVNWKTNELANSTVEYGLNSSYGNQSANSSNSTEHTINISGLQEGTAYHFRIKTSDVLGNTNTSNDMTFKTAIVQRLTVNITANQTTSINATRANLVLSLILNSGVNSTINVTESPDSTANSTLNNTMKYVKIDVPEEIKNSTANIRLQVYYNQTELQNSNLSATSLSLYRYNETTTAWEKLNTTLNWVLDAGVNTTDSYVYANITRFSTYSVNGLISNGNPCSTNSQCETGNCGADFDGSGSFCAQAGGCAHDGTSYNSSQTTCGGDTKWTCSSGAWSSTSCANGCSSGACNSASGSSSSSSSSGGGGGDDGGGGGTTTPKPKETNATEKALKELQEKITNLTKEELQIDTNEITQEVSPGSENAVTINLNNNKKDKAINVELAARGSSKQFLYFPQNISLNPGESRTVKIDIIVPDNAKPQTYTGELTIKTEQQTISVPIRIIIKEKAEKLLDFRIEPLDTIVAPGDELRVQSTLINLGTARRFDVQLKIQLINPKTEAVLLESEEALAVETRATIVTTLKIPEKTPYDKYILKGTAHYTQNSVEQEATSISQIHVQKPFLETLKPYLFQKVLIFQVWQIIAAAMALSAILYSAQIYRRHAAKRRKYQALIDYSKLPRPGRRSGHIGRIAESAKKAYIELDKLQTHTIVAGATGSGKSIAAQVIVEEALRKGIAVIVFDPSAQWTGFLRACKEKNMLNKYAEYGMGSKEAHAFKGNVYQIDNEMQEIEISRYVSAGAINVFAMNKLEPGQIDFFVANTIRAIFRSNPQESQELKILIVYDEVHRLLKKFGGSGEGFIQVERGIREFRKWGIGLVLISQVLSDFVSEIKANIATQIQMRTEDESDLGTLKEKYSEEIAKSIVKAETGTGMIENADYNNGKAYFVSFRPIIHSITRLSDNELAQYKKYNTAIEDVQYQLEQLKELKVDIFDFELELKLASEKLSTGNFSMVDIYLETLEPRLKAKWKSLGKTPKKREIKLVTRTELMEEVKEAQLERKKYIEQEKEKKKGRHETKTGETKKAKATLLLKKKAYIINEKQPENSYKAFFKAINSGYNGLCFTRRNPEEVKKAYKLENAEVYWLTTEPVKEGYSPNNLSAMLSKIKEFTSRNKKAIVLLDGLPLIINYAGFEQALNLLERIKDNSAISNSIFLAQLNLNSLAEKQGEMLRNEMDII
ncbi:DUF853 family protein [Candidatus Woesearchaeota archaeon]|nr:DUF853 family protein [Candidatus Woesearchaeota archaeon]